MNVASRRLSWCLGATLGIWALSADAQQLSARPLRIVTSEFGSATDLTARLIAPALGSALRRNVIVENRGLMAIEVVSRANPDGYTVLCYGPALWLAPLMRAVPYEPFRDFDPVTLGVTTPNLLVVHPSLPVKSVKELIAMAKAKPGELNYGAGSPGATPHMAAELFKYMAGVDLLRISYKGTGPALNGLMSAQVQVMFPNAGAVTPHLKSGRVRALAVASAQPSALAPDLPTIAASGLPGYESASPLAFLSPARTPAAIRAKLNDGMLDVLNRPEIRDKLFNASIEVVASTPEALTGAMKAEVARMGKVIKAAGIRDQ